MAASFSCSITGQLLVPPDEGAPPAPVQFGIVAQCQSEEGGRLVLTGSGTKVVSFGTVGSPGAKLVLIEYLTGTAAAPLELAFNSSSTPLELSPGGFLAYGSPTPQAGITSLTITYTSDCTLRVRLLG